MHHALRSSLSVVAIAAIGAMTGCQTHDRRIYSTHQDKNLHAPNPWAPSTSKAADDATSALDLTPQPAPSSSAVAPGAPPAPLNR